jgi:hypothetical protein
MCNISTTATTVTKPALQQTQLTITETKRYGRNIPPYEAQESPHNRQDRTWGARLQLLIESHCAHTTTRQNKAQTTPHSRQDRTLGARLQLLMESHCAHTTYTASLGAISHCRQPPQQTYLTPFSGGRDVSLWDTGVHEVRCNAYETFGSGKEAAEPHTVAGQETKPRHLVENCTGRSPNTAQQNGQPVNNRQANSGAYVICTPVMVLFAVC